MPPEDKFIPAKLATEEKEDILLDKFSSADVGANKVVDLYILGK